MRRCFAKLRHVTISIHVTSSFRFRSSGSNFEVKCFCQLLVWKCLKSVMWLGSILFLNKLTMLTVAHADWVYRLFVLWYMWILANEVFSLTTNVPTDTLQSQIHTFQTDFRTRDSLVWSANLSTEAARLPTQLAPAVYKLTLTPSRHLVC